MKYHCIIALFVILTACHNANTSTSQKIDDVAGIDINANGIRDDIDDYITKHYTNPDEKKAVEQNAKAMQKTLTVGLIADKETRRMEAKKVSLEVGKSIDCIFYQNTINPNFDVNIAETMESLVTNTQPRLSAYLAYDKALDGTVNAITDGKVACNK